MRTTYNVRTGLTTEKLVSMKKKIIGVSAIVGTVGVMAVPAFAAQPANPGWYGTASPNAQCGTAAGSGGFADEYGNFGYLGPRGGADGHQTGINNSAACGNRQGNL